VVLGLVVPATFAVAAPASWLVAAVESQPLRWPPLAELAQGRAAGWLAGTNAGSVAAAAGVPVPGAPGGTLGVTTTVDKPRRRWCSPSACGLHGGRGSAATAKRHHLTLKERRTAMNAQSTWSGLRAATVAGLVAGAVGIAILWASGVEFPIYPPGIIILLAGAIFVGLTSWPWAPAVGAVLGLFITVGFVASGGLPNLFGQDGTGVAIGTWIQMAGVLTALAAGLITARANYREQAQARQ